MEADGVINTSSSEDVAALDGVLVLVMSDSLLPTLVDPWDDLVYDDGVPVCDKVLVLLVAGLKL